MSEKIVQLNEEVIKGQLKELVRGSVEETLNELLEQEAEKLTQAALASLISLIPGCLREFLCLLLQQLIQRFFHTAARQFLDLTLDNFLV